MQSELSPALLSDRALVEKNLRQNRLLRAVPGVLHNIERMPLGGALLVGNHGPFAMDTAVLIHAIHRETGRIIRPLGDRFLFKNRYGRRFARAWGGVEGNPENAQALLSAGEWVVVYPGGARETLRGPNERYRLAWEGRVGFARSALAARVPIVPVACIGIDEVMRQLVTQEQVLQTLPGRALATLVGKDYVPPLFVPRFRGVQFHYWFGEPIATAELADKGPEQREQATRELSERVKSELEALMEHGQDVRRARQGRRAEPSTPQL